MCKLCITKKKILKLIVLTFSDFPVSSNFHLNFRVKVSLMW